jgi:hypothetical protein
MVDVSAALMAASKGNDRVVSLVEVMGARLAAYLADE